MIRSFVLRVLTRNGGCEAAFKERFLQGAPLGVREIGS
jgi:hypothetical protein